MMTFTNSSLVSYTNISPSKNSPRNAKIDTITIHCMAGQMKTKNCVDMFAVKANRVSSNYCVGCDATVGLSVAEADRSWCSSSGENDHRAVTIEVACDPEYPYAVKDTVYNKMLDLVTDVCKRNGITKLVWSTNKTDRVNHKNGCNMTVHRDYANKACPGEYLYSRMGAIAEEVNKRLAPATQTANTSGTIYTVQCGAFKSKENAEKMQKSLSAKGIESFVTVKGDINGDGKITVADAQALLSKAVGK